MNPWPGKSPWEFAQNEGTTTRTQTNRIRKEVNPKLGPPLSAEIPTQILPIKCHRSFQPSVLNGAAPLYRNFYRMKSWELPCRECATHADVYVLLVHMVFLREVQASCVSEGGSSVVCLSL